MQSLKELYLATPRKRRREIASSLGISVSYLTRWITAGIPLNRVVDVANLFGLTVSELIDKHRLSIKNKLKA